MVRESSNEPVAEGQAIPVDDPADSAADGATTTDPPTRSSVRRRPRKALLMLTGLAFAVGLGFAVWTMGDPAPAAAELPDGHPDIAQTTAMPAAAPTTPALDEAQVAALTAKVEADPSDVVSMRTLADVYFRGEQFAESATWLERFVEQQPNDLDSRLVLGVAYFNVNRVADAEAQWQRAAEISPTSPHPWFNLGFARMAQDPPDVTGAVAAWERVSELAPGSDIAASAQEHRERLLASEAVGSPTPTPPASEPTPATTP